MNAPPAHQPAVLRLKPRTHPAWGLFFLLVGCGGRQPSDAAAPQPSPAPSATVDVAAPAAVSFTASPATKEEEPSLLGLALQRVGEAGFEDMQVVGDAALLSDGFWGRQLYLIADGEVQEVSGLNAYFQSEPALWAAGGSWPDNAWMAISQTSDAGPSWSWIYKWHPSKTGTGKWRLVREHGASIGQIQAWRQGVVLVEFSPQIAVELKPYSVLWMTESSAAFLHAGATADHLPWLGTASRLSGFGLASPESIWLVPGSSLQLDQWDRSGRSHTRTVVLPKSSRAELWADWRVRMEGDEIFWLQPPSGEEPQQLLRLVGGQWEVAELPENFTLVQSHDHTLWGLSGRQLLRWSETGWLPVAHLPEPLGAPEHDCRPDAEEAQVWARTDSDIWFLACGQLFNTARGTSSVSLQSEEEKSALIAQRREWDDSCQHIEVDVLALAATPINGDSWKFTPSEGRALLRQKLQPHPEFHGLEFVQYRCFGHDCIAAVVPDAKTGQALREAMRPHHYDLNYTSELFCGEHPSRKPFRVFP